jgi:hypothetical protein
MAQMEKAVGTLSAPALMPRELGGWQLSKFVVLARPAAFSFWRRRPPSARAQVIVFVNALGYCGQLGAPGSVLAFGSRRCPGGVHVSDVPFILISVRAAKVTEKHVPFARGLWSLLQSFK